jgi:hypothetical protein
VDVFTPTVLMHPLSFPNKVLIGSEQGALQLWNIDRVALIHHFGRFEGKRINAVVQVSNCL